MEPESFVHADRPIVVGFDEEHTVAHPGEGEVAEPGDGERAAEATSGSGRVDADDVDLAERRGGGGK